ncbi:Armadillo-type fold [Pseudocohnilembus persalinus]|uniref:Armadillo-type fold n=1 Tax=Pseudocohnilembus persalinus TaxID=266149 RepID=A0A0V0QB18_PSEPJ|nr:Armadillo-type fold [Pseudocohnilembus persalinus]|eukprot:KRW99355.1 Armadillo-type fold [Pseudocohnilembus persalinus]
MIPPKKTHIQEQKQPQENFLKNKNDNRKKSTTQQNDNSIFEKNQRKKSDPGFHNPGDTTPQSLQDIDSCKSHLKKYDKRKFQMSLIPAPPLERCIRYAEKPLKSNYNEKLISIQNDQKYLKQENLRYKKKESQDNQQTKQNPKTYLSNQERINLSKAIQEKYKDNSIKNLTFEQEIKDNIVNFSQDKYFYFVINLILDEGNIGHKQWIFELIYNSRHQIIVDSFGYRIFTKCIEISQTESYKDYRKFVEFILNEQEHKITQIFFDKYANYVVQRCQEIFEDQYLEALLILVQKQLLKPEKQYKLTQNQFENSDLCSDQYGCLIVQKIIEINNQKKSPKIAQVIVQTLELSKQKFSNYIIQQIIEKGSAEYKDIVHKKIVENFIDLSFDKYGSNVTERTVIFSNESQRVQIWSILEKNNNELPSQQSNKGFNSPKQEQNNTNNNLNPFQESTVMKNSSKSFLQNSQHIRKEEYQNLIQESQVIDQHDLSLKIQKLRYIQCENENHSGNVLNQICIDKKCHNYFQLVCIDCIEDQKLHKHRNNFRGLKKFCENLADNIDELQKGLHQKNQNNQSWYFETAEILQEISEQCKEIRKNLLLTYKDIINGQPYQEIKKSKELMFQILNDKSANNLQQTLFDLNEQLQLNGEQAFIKKSQNSTQIQKNVENYQENIKNNLKQLQEKANIFLRQSHSIEYKPLLWTFQKQNNQQSQAIKEIQNGTEFEGTKKLNQFLYSTQFFDKGTHGLTTEINKNSDILNLKQTPYSCIFCKDLKNQMIAQPSQFCIGDAIQPGQKITVIMDVKTNTFDITLDDSKISYKVQNFYIKGKNMGFFIAWSNSNSKIALLESF